VSNRDTSTTAPEAVSPAATTKPADPALGLRGFLLLDATGRLLIWVVAIVLTIAIFSTLHLWPNRRLVGADLGDAWKWGRAVIKWVVLFNLVYVAGEGTYSTTGPSWQMLVCGLNATLVHARNEVPFPGFLVFHIATLPPMHWLMGPVFGPRSKSCYLADPRVIDPFLVSIGRNVVVGFGAIIAGHWRLRDSITIKRTVIEDHVLIGGNAVIFSGVHIKSGSVIGAGAIVRPRTVVGPNEFCAGVPAKRISHLPAPSAQPAG